MSSSRTRLVRHLGYRCLGPTVTPRKIERLQAWLARSPALARAQRQARILAGRTRLSILALLEREPELCVCDLADMLKTTVSATSHQLRVLRQQALVTPKRKGKTIFYALAPRGQRELHALWRNHEKV